MVVGLWMWSFPPPLPYHGNFHPLCRTYETRSNVAWEPPHPQCPGGTFFVAGFVWGVWGGWVETKIPMVLLFKSKEEHGWMEKKCQDFFLNPSKVGCKVETKFECYFFKVKRNIWKGHNCQDFLFYPTKFQLELFLCLVCFVVEKQKSSQLVWDLRVRHSQEPLWRADSQGRSAQPSG